MSSRGREVDEKGSGRSSERRNDAVYAQAVNRDCARFLRDNHHAAWLNREQDLGSPGLCQAKLSYHPDTLLRDFLLIPRE